jgi:hypothetical protein
MPDCQISTSIIGLRSLKIDTGFGAVVLCQMVQKLVKSYHSDFGLKLFEESRITIAWLDGVPVFQFADWTINSVLHLAGLLVVLGLHQVCMGIDEVAMDGIQSTQIVTKRALKFHCYSNLVTGAK